AGARKGSGNFTAVMRGRAAHAGREHHLGRNAVAALAEFITGIDALNGQREGMTVNAAMIDGGKALNVVPDMALCRFNIRVEQPADQTWIEDELVALRARIGQRDGITIEFHGGFGRPPKVLSDHNGYLFRLFSDCGERLGITIAHKPTGGCCDGNNLAAAGLANIDTLGVRGGNIHSAEEFLLLDSLTERAKLTALFLMKLGAGEIAWPPGDDWQADYMTQDIS
ncbi:MAG: M20/M25/M40 family metallo-hydrolase, partial [Sphingomonadales bacterium]